MSYKLIQGDCLEVLPTLEAGSVDCVLVDVPYGTTACKWDTVIPFPPMWAGIKHVRKERAAVVMFGSEPFSSLLRVSNLDEFKYDWIWNKVNPSGMSNAKYQPMKQHEIISVFGKSIKYNPQKKKRSVVKKSRHYGKAGGTTQLTYVDKKQRTYTDYHPKTILKVSNAHRKGGLHPTQKPVALLEYLIRTYTNEGDTVLDFTMGSGSTGVAAMKTGRNFIGIELDADYFKIAEQRIANAAGDYVATDKEKDSPQPSLFW